MLLTAIKAFLFFETRACKSCSALLAFLSISVKNLREFLKEIIEAIYHYFFCFVLNPFPFLINLKISIEDLFPITSNTLYCSLDFIFWQPLI